MSRKADFFPNFQEEKKKNSIVKKYLGKKNPVIYSKRGLLVLVFRMAFWSCCLIKGFLKPCVEVNVA